MMLRKIGSTFVSVGTQNYVLKHRLLVCYSGHKCPSWVSVLFPGPEQYAKTHPEVARQQLIIAGLQDGICQALPQDIHGD